jgi:hypothetical protein
MLKQSKNTKKEFLTPLKIRLLKPILEPKIFMEKVKRLLNISSTDLTMKNNQNNKLYKKHHKKKYKMLNKKPIFLLVLPIN